MYKVLVGSRGPGLLERAIAALVRELHPDWAVECIQLTKDDVEDGVIKVAIPASARWAAVFVPEADCVRAAAALADGASAVIGVNAELEQLDRALRVTTNGGDPYIPAELARGLARGLLRRDMPDPPAPASPFPRLTARETQVLELVGAGLSNREIAERLTLSVNTVRSHLQTLSTKLSAPSRARMVANAWESGLYAPAERSNTEPAAS